MKTNSLQWISHENPRPDIQADVVSAGDYVISCRPGRFVLSHRPQGKHTPVGEYPTLEMAKSIAEKHANR